MIARAIGIVLRGILAAAVFALKNKFNLFALVGQMPTAEREVFVETEGVKK